MNWLTPEFAGNAIRFSWLVLAAIWIWMARSTKQIERRESPVSRLSYTALMLLGFLLTYLPFGGLLAQDIFPRSPLLLLIAVTANGAGLAFAIWARFYLGGNWSATVTVKEGHELIRSGPYRVTRHPIYTGILLACVGLILEADRYQGILGLIVIFFALRMKSRIEEQLMSEKFGAAYDEYRRTTRALIPLII